MVFDDKVCSLEWILVLWLRKYEIIWILSKNIVGFVFIKKVGIRFLLIESGYNF